MSRWSLHFSKEAEQDLAELDSPIRTRIIVKLEWLMENFASLTPAPLAAEWSDFFKLRVGDWRVVYTIHWTDHRIVVEYIDRRDKIYKRR
ncbi:MAG: type II toxin-antitoxin system RelE/ParE family toxin [Candidatus Sungbacteria bacterium]|nr:type II toxin-antitoxin system RelE/ParE family toxin [Candidatus Sungbacteria bacterium]